MFLQANDFHSYSQGVRQPADEDVGTRAEETVAFCLTNAEKLLADSVASATQCAVS
jgi:hypothetical protein